MATLKFEMNGRKGNPVDFEDFGQFSSRLSESVLRVSRILNLANKKPRFEIHSLENGSAICTVYADGHGGNSLNEFVGVVTALRDKRDLPLRVTSADVRIFKKLAEPLDSHTESILLNDELPIDSKFVAGCEWSLSQSQKSIGQIIGRLDGVNIHSMRFFRVYPEGIDRGAECNYPLELHEKIVSLLGKRVQVEGTIHRDPDGVGIDRVTDVTSVNELAEDNELPSLSDLFGLFKSQPVNVAAGWGEHS